MSATRVNGLRLMGQGESNWCWAAVTQALLNRKGIERTQEELVTDHIQSNGRTYSCEPPNRERTEGGYCSEDGCTASCNDVHSLRAVLRQHGLFDMQLSTNGPPSFEKIQKEIDEQRPVPSKIRWGLGDGHVILVNGYFFNEAGKPCVLVLDPASAKEGVEVAEEPMLHYTYANEYKQPGKLGRVEFSYRIK